MAASGAHLGRGGGTSVPRPLLGGRELERLVTHPQGQRRGRVVLEQQLFHLPAAQHVDDVLEALDGSLLPVALLLEAVEQLGAPPAAVLVDGGLDGLCLMGSPDLQPGPTPSTPGHASLVRPAAPGRDLPPCSAPTAGRTVGW
jgi:hypothetical protein